MSQLVEFFFITSPSAAHTDCRDKASNYVQETKMIQISTTK